MLDLHTHSTASDGSLTPAELVDMAEESGLTAVALTDHDTVGGIPEAIDAAVSKNVELVPGVELSAESASGSLHMLGLFINHNNPNLTRTLERVQEMRRERNPRLLNRLSEIGMPISEEDLRIETNGPTIGRLHIAQAMVRKGYVKNTQDAFARYIGPNGMAIVPKERLAPAECVKIIREAGGVPILAHPKTLGLKGDSLRNFIGELKEQGLMGIEVFYSTYEATYSEMLSKLAREFNLVRSGGSDFHGTNKPDIKLGKGKGSLYVHPSLLNPIRNLTK